MILRWLNIIEKLKAFAASIKNLRARMWEFFAARANLEDELIIRREEVVKRAICAANRTFPPSLADKGFPDLLKWVILPHISKLYIPYFPEDGSKEKRALRTVYKILEEVENEEGGKKDENEKN